MRCTNCLRKKFTKLNLCQNVRLCKIKKNKTILPLTKINIEKWCQDIYDAETEDEIEIDKNNVDNIIKDIQKLKL